MIRLRYAACILAPALVPAGACAQVAPINLICEGQAATDTAQSQYGVEVGKGQGSVVVGSTTQRVTLDDSAQVRISADGSGAMRAPRRLFDAKKSSADGWYPLSKLKIGPSEISARLRYGLTGSAAVVIDRVTGRLSITSAIGDFSAACRTFDPKDQATKF